MRAKTVPLKEVLENIKSCAFATSPYPLIINLELQCRSQYQEKGIELMNEILGANNILVLPEGMTEEEVKALPSPSVLKGKYILKCIRPRFVPKKVNETEELPLDDPTEANPLGMLNGREKYLTSTILQRLQQDEQDEQEEVKSSMVGREESVRLEQNDSLKKSEMQLQKIMVAEKLIKSVFLIAGMKLDLKKLRYPWEVAAISANRMEIFRHENKEESDWLHYTTKRLAVVTSSLKIDNDKVAEYKVMDPFLLWKLGVQMAGICRAMKDDNKAKNDMFFYQGGSNLGYVLKHCRLIYPFKTSIILCSPSLVRFIRIKLLSVNQIPVVKEFSAESEFVLEFFVKGAKCDEQVSFKFSFKSNGFRYLFEAENCVKLRITYPLEALIMVALKHEGEVIGRAVFPAMSIRQGYRNIPLCDKDYRGYAFSNILGKFEVKDHK